MSDKVSIKHISWRNGRPRFNPGISLRRLGYGGQDLRHENGNWFTDEEAREYSATLDAMARMRLGKPHRAPGPDTAQEPRLVVAAPKAKATNHSGFVYFLRSGDRLKIGFSRDPVKRLTALRTSMSHSIETIAVVRGTEREERSLHWQLRTYRRNGEWFECHPSVMEVMIRSLTFGKVMLDDTNGSRTKVANARLSAGHDAKAGQLTHGDR